MFPREYFFIPKEYLHSIFLRIFLFTRTKVFFVSINRPLMLTVSMDNNLSTSILVSMVLQVTGKRGLCLLTYTVADRCRYYYAER